MKWCNTISPFLVAAALMLSVGCGQEHDGNAAAGPRNAKARSSASLPRHRVLPDGTDVPMSFRNIVELKEHGDLEGYLTAARDYLGTNRNDLVAADLMTVYAQMRMTNEFRSFGIAYATNSALLLEFADIANNEAWVEMRKEFALETARRRSATFAELFRAVGFLMNATNRDEIVDFVKRLDALAVKRYQKEDMALMKCELSMVRGESNIENAETLEKLAKDAMMPQVRKKAKELARSSKEGK